MELVEVDKQAHKMIVAWLLFLQNSRDLDVARKRALGESIVEGGIFDYLYRLVITDINRRSSIVSRRTRTIIEH